MKKVFYLLSEASAFVKSFLKECVCVCWFLFVQILVVCMATASWHVVAAEFQHFHTVIWFSLMESAQSVVHGLSLLFLVCLGLFGILFLLAEAVFFWAFIKGVCEATYKRTYIKDRLSEFSRWILS